MGGSGPGGGCGLLCMASVGVGGHLLVGGPRREKRGQPLEERLRFAVDGRDQRRDLAQGRELGLWSHLEQVVKERFVVVLRESMRWWRWEVLVLGQISTCIQAGGARDLPGAIWGFDGDGLTAESAGCSVDCC